MRRIAPEGRLARAVALTPAALLAAYACVLAFDLGGPAVEDFFSTWVYNVLIVASALLCVTRAVAVPAERMVWVLVGLALTCWTASELYFELVLADEEFTPYPSLGDWLFLAFYPMVYCAFVLLARLRIREFQRAAVARRADRSAGRGLGDGRAGGPGHHQRGLGHSGRQREPRLRAR
jgi:hypothetical protein